MVEGIDYYLEFGRVVFTATYHLKRGHCCNNSCRHCPYKKPNLKAMDIRIKLLHADSKLPVLGSTHAACYDVYARSIKTHPTEPYKVIVGLGFATEIPIGYKGIIVPRSNLTNYNWVLNNSFGVVDADYRGEWMAIFTNVNMPLYNGPKEVLTAFPYDIGDRVAQIYFEQVLPVNLIVSEELNDSERGVGGFGSTGLK